MALPDYRVESCVIQHQDDIEQDWLDLQSRVHCSFFQSWGWIGTWLGKIAIDHHPIVVRVWLADSLVGMGVFVHKRIYRHLIVRSDAYFLNEYPFDGCNMIIEYNGILSGSRHESHLYKEIIEHFFSANQGCSELFFSGVQSISPLIQATEEIEGVQIKILEESSTWSIDINEFSQDDGTYLATLSKNRRAQIRRSIKLYEGKGLLQIVEAGSLKEAMEFFDGLKELHTARWESKGFQGAFANPHWESFHRDLIRSRYARGDIQLLKVHASNIDIGYIYNLVWRQHVYVLQTGFQLSDDKRLMPGYIAHILAIDYNKNKGMKVYDLMHGDSVYKTILCNQRQSLQWVVLQRKQLPFMLEDIARKVFRKCRLF
jgi:CelD/BcsL family acetyltransferase involved in cellulose biosynthesis